MSFEKIIGIIRDLNSGSIISDNSEKETFVHLNDKLQLYISKENKYYFISEYQGSNNLRNLGLIEKEISVSDNSELEVKPRPRDSYLVLFYLVDEINEEVLKEVIAIEENEYLFKKYIFYYTKSELDAFLKWYEDKKSNGTITANQIINNNEITPELSDMNKDYINFFFRLVIKFPCFNLTFNPIEYKDFETYLTNEIKSMRSRSEEIEQLNMEIQSIIESVKYDIDAATDALLSIKLGDDSYEL